MIVFNNYPIHESHQASRMNLTDAKLYIRNKMW